MAFYITQPVDPFHLAARSVNTFTTKQDVSPGPVPVIRAGTLRPESQITIRAGGSYTTTGTPNITLGFWIGPRTGVGFTDLALSSVITTATATEWPWDMEWHGLVLVAGTSGSVLGQGRLQLGSSLIAFNAEVPIPITQALRTVTVDTTIERALGISCTWSASSASNQITTNYLRAQILN